ncbi:GL23871 [Drosophila persimilis]|uniref:GL23871 n=1 Tax=Drosophila persimilis TaxID=7234 RepID=B4G5U6_DROPE|nr:GL23871 [Drosophila persimilis]
MKTFLTIVCGGVELELPAEDEAENGNKVGGETIANDNENDNDNDDDENDEDGTADGG